MDEKIVKDSQGLAKDLVNDCINRQAAIDVINESNSPIAEYLIGEIMALPSAQPYTDEEIQKMQDIEQAQLYKAYECGLKAQPERQKGKWIPLFDGRPNCGVCWFYCSKCERVVRNGEWNFCPNCGADMREG